jgi:hypothetical protein
LPLPAARNLFVVPASGGGAREHVDATIASPVDPAKLAPALRPEHIQRLNNDGQGVFAWGAIPGPGNLRTWNSMAAGDYVVFYQFQQYTYVARTIEKFQSEELARQLWGVDDNGKTWELMFFLSTPRRISKSLADLADFLQAHHYQGFSKITDDRLTRILAKYQDLESFVEQRLSLSQDTYLLLRSNASSPWNDEDARAYHYAKTVPNYTKMVPGAKFIVDRKTPDGNALIGWGEVASVQALPDKGGYVASYGEYHHFDPPHLIEPELQNIIAALPNYNVQHSIRVLNQQVFLRLSGFSTMAEASPNELATSIHWPEEDAARLFGLFVRSPQMILAGPPGTGKSFIANRLAELVTRGHAGRIERLQFHPSYQYEDFIEGVRPVLATDEGGDKARVGISYELRNGVLKRLVSIAIQNPAETFVLVIDEMNRANVSRVFGELLFCLEYRQPEYKVRLPYSDEEFYVPENLKIIATINTADRSIALIDTAFRRRFHQYTLAPSPDVIRRWHAQRGSATVGDEAADRLERLNGVLLDLIDKGRLIGHSYFLRDVNAVGYDAIWHEDIEPVLAEYFFNSVGDLDRCRDAFLSS